MLKAANSNSSCLIQELPTHLRPKAKHPYFNIHRHGPLRVRLRARSSNLCSPEQSVRVENVKPKVFLKKVVENRNVVTTRAQDKKHGGRTQSERRLKHGIGGL